MQTLYDLSRDWYRGHRDRAWMPIDGEAAKTIFASHGLTGPFWEVG